MQEHTYIRLYKHMYTCTHTFGFCYPQW